MDLTTVSRVAVKAAYRSADILRSRIGHLSTVAKKGPTDLVTDADLASEAEIVRTIREVFPEHAIAFVTWVAAASGAVFTLKISPTRTETPWSLSSQRDFRAPTRGSPSESWRIRWSWGAHSLLCSSIAIRSPFTNVFPKRS